jgi:hypothetical protein
MVGKIDAWARATRSAKYMIRANWSLVGGLRTELLPTQAKAFQLERCHTSGAQMSFALPGVSQKVGWDLLEAAYVASFANSK